MSEDVFGQLCFFTFVSVPTLHDYPNNTRGKRVKLATIHCKRSECNRLVENFKSDNDAFNLGVCAEFSFREML